MVVTKMLAPLVVMDEGGEMCVEITTANINTKSDVMVAMSRLFVQWVIIDAWQSRRLTKQDEELPNIFTSTPKAKDQLQPGLYED